MKKICFLSGDITRSGGTEKVACQIMNGLTEHYEVHVLSLTESEAKLFYPLSDRVKRAFLFPEDPDGTRQFLPIVFGIRRFLLKNSIDVLIDVDTILDMFSVPAVLGTKVRLVGWEHFHFEETMGNRLRVPIRKYVSRFADCVVTLTKEDQKAYSDYFGKKLRVEQIYNPVEMPDYEPVYHADSKTIISVGRLAKQKGFDYLLDAAELVFRRHPDWQWQILGEGDQRALLEAGIAQRKLSQVKLMGRVSDVSAFLQQASIFALTSRYEGFPLVMIEAKANGLPIVSFECRTGPKELVQDEINGFLVPCFQTDVFADRICKLIENSEMRKQFAQKSSLDLEQLDNQQIIHQWCALMEKLL